MRTIASRSPAGVGSAKAKEVGVAEEAGDEGVDGMLVEMRGVAVLDDPAVVHDGDPVRHGRGLVLVVRDVEDGRV